MDEGSSRAPRTVYVLGAGFSYNAGIPLQSKILDGIREWKWDLTTLPEDIIGQCIELQERSIDFVNEIFAHTHNPALEDVFTLLDESILKRRFCLGYKYTDLDTIRQSFYISIVLLFLTIEAKHSEGACDFYRKLANYFIGQRKNAGQENQTFSIISLNWDSVIENAIFREFNQQQIDDADVDYCCFTHPFEGTIHHIPSILQRAKGLYNIKMMKLHGSVNWALCPNCDCLFVGLGATYDEIFEYVSGRICPECHKIYNVQGDEANKPTLEPFIVSPTYTKQFDNTHIGYVWHNAARELSKATKIVFIGYSLPYADYHLRTLLKRSIQPGTEIEVVLVESDRPQGDSSVRHYYAPSRYEEFFGTGHLNIHYNGVDGYFSGILNS